MSTICRHCQTILTNTSSSTESICPKCYLKIYAIQDFLKSSLLHNDTDADGEVSHIFLFSRFSVRKSYVFRIKFVALFCTR
jgi:hypothetical protein